MGEEARDAAFAGYRGLDKTKYLSKVADLGAKYTPDEVEFIMAIDRFKRESNVRFPTCSDVLKVLLALGYRKTGSGEPQPTSGQWPGW